MEILPGNDGKHRTINGDFLCSQQEPVSNKTSNNNNNDTAKGKKFSKIPSRCQLNCENGYLFIYGLSMTTPFLILPKIWKVSRQQHDKEFFCLEYGTETVRLNIFLTITNKSDAEEWEFELCKLTGQPPPSRRRVHTGIPPRRPNRAHALSSPSVPQGFSLAEQDGGDVSPTNADATDETMSVEHEDDTIPTCSSDTQPEPEDTQAPVLSTITLGDDQEETDDSLTLERQRTSRRDGQRSPEESHVGVVVGYENVSPTPGNSPNSRLSDEIPNEDCTNSVLEETNLKLKEHQQQEQQQQQHETNDDRLSDILPLKSRDFDSEMGISQSSDQPPSGLASSRLPGALRSTEPACQCTHIEIACSQVKSSLTINKENFLSTGEIDDLFVCYRGSVYLKSCPESFQSQLFIGTCILRMNNQEPDDAIRAIDYITTSAGQTVKLLVQLFPLGVRVRLCVPSVAALGISLHGNEILSMHEDGLLSRIADGLRCVCPALSTTDMPNQSVEQRSITAIGDSHVPFDATSDEVEDMLDSAINIGNGHLVLQLQPTEFCQAIAPDALQRRIVKEDNALLNPRPARRPSRTSLAKSLKSNPPS